MNTVTLGSGPLRATILPGLGAGIADFSVKGPGGYFFPIMRRAAPGETNASLLGSFIMAPWVNRIAGAAFEYAGKQYTLRATTADGMAQHGDVRRRAWRLLTSSSGHAELEYTSHGVPDSNWPWAFSCRARYELDEGGLTITLCLRNEDREAFPAGCGHHPYFARRLWADCDEIELRARVAGRYPLKAGCAIGPPVPDALTDRLAAFSRLPDEHIDAVFGGFEGPAELCWAESGVTLRMTASANMKHLVVFAPQESQAGGGRRFPLSFVAVEPQTQVNNALNLEARGELGSQGGGSVVLQPGESLDTRCRFDVSALG